MNKRKIQCVIPVRSGVIDSSEVRLFKYEYGAIKYQKSIDIESDNDDVYYLELEVDESSIEKDIKQYSITTIKNYGDDSDLEKEMDMGVEWSGYDKGDLFKNDEMIGKFELEVSGKKTYIDGYDVTIEFKSNKEKNEFKNIAKRLYPKEYLSALWDSENISILNSDTMFFIMIKNDATIEDIKETWTRMVKNPWQTVKNANKILLDMKQRYKTLGMTFY